MKQSSRPFTLLLVVLSFLFLLSAGCSYNAWTKDSQARKRLDYIRQLDKKINEGARPEILGELKVLRSLGLNVWEKKLNGWEKGEYQCEQMFIAYRDDEFIFDSFYSLLMPKQTNIAVRVKTGLIIGSDYYHRFNAF